MSCACEYAVVGKFVGNKAKRRISKRVFPENKACQIFRKTNISYPLIRTCTRTYQGVRNFHFSENLVCFVLLKTIRFFALLPTTYHKLHHKGYHHNQDGV